jgi:hypothetical protein
MIGHLAAIAPGGLGVPCLLARTGSLKILPQHRSIPAVSDCPKGGRMPSGRNRTVALVVSFLLGCSPEPAPGVAGELCGGPDDTFACLDQPGPIVVLDQSYGYEQLRTKYASNTKVDGRGGVWNMQNYDTTPGWQRYPIMVSGEGLCVAGARVEGTNPLDVGWAAAYCIGRHSAGKKCGNAAALSFGRDRDSDHAVIDGVRLHNVWDGIRPSGNKGIAADNFTIRNVWMSHVRDDAVENDGYYAGLIEDSLLDGIFVFLSTRSSRGNQPNNVVTVRNNLVRMEPFPMEDPVCLKRSNGMCHGAVFKHGAPKRGPQLRITDNLFVWDGNLKEGRIGDIFLSRKVYDKVIECRNNTVIWQGPGAFRDSFVEANAECFTVLDATKDPSAMSVWQEAKQNWINCHPNVPRRPGDPAPNGACDPNSFGGGQPKPGGCDAEVAEQASR